jgi:hypothetical protein
MKSESERQKKIINVIGIEEKPENVVAKLLLIF